MLNLHLYFLQRLSALFLAPMVIVHLIVMIYAVRGGLSAEEILSRTRDGFFWSVFYGSFVVAAAVHAAIGVRVVVHEWLQIEGRMLALIAWGVLCGCLYLGTVAVYAVTIA